jgi:hypothetical protein
MALPVYATATEYKKFLGVEELDAATKEVNAGLRRASNEVRGLTRTAIYDTDADTGMPTDEGVLEAFRDATCAFVAYWDETGDITGAGAISGPVKILSVSLGGTATGGASSRNVADTRRSDEAVTILRNAGLIGSAVSHS